MSLYDDLAAARKEMPHPKMDSTGHAGKNGSRMYQYASLKSVLDAVMPPLLARGMFLTQSLCDGILSTEVHKGDEAVVLDRRAVDLSGSSQEQGSAETYAKRYALCSVFCISGEEDDDGKSASQRKQPQKPAQGQRKPAKQDDVAAAKQALWASCKAYAERHGADARAVSDGCLKRPDFDGSAEWYMQVAAELDAS